MVRFFKNLGMRKIGSFLKNSGVRVDSNLIDGVCILFFFNWNFFMFFMLCKNIKFS